VDSLTPLLFCIRVALIPLTNELIRADCGYQVHGTERKISHVLYVDDLKLLGRNENDLQNMTIIQILRSGWLLLPRRRSESAKTFRLPPAVPDH
jgi:hypothetical protein